MKNYLLPFVLLFIFSCGKDDEVGQRSSFPEIYTFTEFDYGSTDLFVIDGSRFDLIPLSGSFIDPDLSVVDEVRQGNPFTFSELEFVDEQNVNVTGGDGANTITVAMEYQTDGDMITFFEDGVANFVFEKDETNAQLKLCYNTNWGTFISSGGDWEISPPYVDVSCPTKNTTEITEKMINIFPDLDTIAINFSNDVFDLVE